MKTLTRIVVVAAVLGVIYFATIGSNQFYRLLDFFSDLLQVIGDNYLRK
jgi:hypothetical protein